MIKTVYWVVESGNPINPVILGGMNKNIWDTFLGLLYPTGAKTLEEAKEVKKYAQKYYVKKFIIMEKVQ